MHNVSFKGYSNIISGFKIPVGGWDTSYIAMKLDDKGEKDLSKLKEIRKLQGYPPNMQNEDILTLIHIADDISEDIYFADKNMCWGEQLKIARESYVPQIISPKKFKLLDDLHLKAYTLLASLTKRMANEKFENEDKEITRVIQTLFNNLKKLTTKHYCVFYPEEAFELTAVGCLKQAKFQTTAASFNKKIVETMTAYFR